MAVPARTRLGMGVRIGGWVVIATESVNDPGKEEKNEKVKVFSSWGRITLVL